MMDPDIPAPITVDLDERGVDLICKRTRRVIRVMPDDQLDVIFHAVRPATEEDLRTTVVVRYG